MCRTLQKFAATLAFCLLLPALLESQTSTATSTQSAAVPAGMALFEGARVFSNGGTACIACHSVPGLTILGGGAVGPDLTRSFTKYGGEQGLNAVLTSVPFPTMAPLYRGHALLPEERTDLAAYLRSVGSGVPTQGVLPLVLFIVAGVAGLIVILNGIWSYRLGSVRDSLESR